jgi:DNA-binding response OmpR family regulator
MSKERQKTILVIDDEVDLAELLKVRLMHEGYNVLTAYDGKQGIHMIDNEHIDLVLLDIMLPKIGGIEYINIYPILNPSFLS